jgi:hypothetical protein
MLGEKLEMNLELETDKGPMRTKNLCGMMGKCAPIRVC